jgi:hypothetical protein
MMKRLEKLGLWFVWHLPRRFVYCVANRAVAEYTCVGAPKKEVGTVTAMEVLGWWSCPHD